MIILICRTSIFLAVFYCFLFPAASVNAATGSIQINNLIQQDGTLLSSLDAIPNTKSLLTLEDLIDIALKNNQSIESVRQKKHKVRGNLSRLNLVIYPIYQLKHVIIIRKERIQRPRVLGRIRNRCCWI